MQSVLTKILLAIISTVLISCGSGGSSGGSTINNITTPTVNINSPHDGESGVSRTPQIQIQFSESVINVDFTNITLHESSADGASITINSIAAGSNNTYNIITPKLAATTEYYLVIGDGITSVQGVHLNTTTFRFTTQAIVTPTVAILTPHDGESDVSRTPEIQIRFSESVFNIDNNITLHESSADGSSIALNNITPGSNNTYTFSPQSRLNRFAQYFVVIESNIVNIDGGRLSKTTFSFSTENTPTPTVALLEPTDGESGVARNPNIRIQFSESVVNVDANNITLHESSISGRVIPLTGITAESNNTYTFSPQSELNTFTTYFVVVESGITDTEDDALTTTSFSFRVGGLNQVWVSGSQVGRESGNYGTKGVAAPSNMPGAREAAASWADNAGNLWLFGGYGFATTNLHVLMNDLWKYNISSNTWTWVNGSNIGNESGIYGTQGIAAVNNNPGARNGAATWLDNNGNLWLFGGRGKDINGNEGELNDLWKYDISNNTWTWVAGSSIKDQAGVYGTQGIESVGNIPGARNSMATWVDESGNLWLFGGISTHPSVLRSFFNDLWRYNIANNTWTWVNGSNQVNQTSIYGTRGLPAINNTPGARTLSVSWVDNSGKLWLFGGFSSDSDDNSSLLFNDLWQYNIADNTWTWVNGSNLSNQNGIYGIQGIPSGDNTPGARYGAVGWIDNAGNLWLFGGTSSGIDELDLDDLWQYNISNNNWTWIAGSNTGNEAGRYGTQGIGAASNMPGGRSYSTSWVDSSGTLWLFGGAGRDINQNYGDLNDLWILQQD